MSTAAHHPVERCDHNRFAAQFAERIADGAPKPPAERRPRSTPPAQQQPIAVTPMAVPTTSAAIVHAALASGNIEMYREAVALAKEMDAIAARKAFYNALTDVKGKLPILKKNRLVDFANRNGDRTTYRHEDLAEVVRTVVPLLSEHGLSHRYRLKSKPGESVTVICILSHRDGYSEENDISAAADNSGAKNSIQAVKSTVTYLERITLLASLGLAASDDDDGRASEQMDAEQPPADSGCISPEQAERLRNGLRLKGASERGFVQWAKQKRIEDIPAIHFDACVQAITNFRSVQR